jgi:hypothetical protein
LGINRRSFDFVHFLILFYRWATAAPQEKLLFSYSSSGSSRFRAASEAFGFELVAMTPKTKWNFQEEKKFAIDGEHFLANYLVYLHYKCVSHFYKHYLSYPNYDGKIKVAGL